MHVLRAPDGNRVLGSHAGSCLHGPVRRRRGRRPTSARRPAVSASSAAISSACWANCVSYSSAYRPPAREQLGVPAALDDVAVEDHQDLRRLAHRREAVRDDDRGASGERGLERLLDRDLRLRVEMGGRLVEDDDLGRLQQQARDGDALLLAAREAVAAVADDGVEAVRQRLDERQDLRRAQGVDRAPRRSRPAWRTRGWRGSWSWNRCASCVTTPIVRRIDSSVASRTSMSLIRTAPPLTS